MGSHHPSGQWRLPVVSASMVGQKQHHLVIQASSKRPHPQTAPSILAAWKHQHSQTPRFTKNSILIQCNVHSWRLRAELLPAPASLIICAYWNWVWPPYYLHSKELYLAMEIVRSNGGQGIPDILCTLYICMYMNIFPKEESYFLSDFWRSLWSLKVIKHYFRTNLDNVFVDLILTWANLTLVYLSYEISVGFLGTWLGVGKVLNRMKNVSLIS